jgi:hypothetical protein
MNSRAGILALSCLGLALLGFALLGFACAGQSDDRARTAEPPPGAPAATPTPGDPDLITGNGTVHRLEIEGGFFGIVADEGAHYDPGELDARFRRDGLRVRFDLRRNPGQASMRQWGTLVTVVRIDSL